MTDEDDELLVKSIVHDVLDDDDQQAPPATDPLSKITDSTFAELLGHVSVFQNEPNEHAVVLSADGGILERRIGFVDRVATAPHPGGVAAHNHPENWPPNWDDIDKMIRDGLAFMTVATRCGTFYHFAPAGIPLSDLRIHFQRIFDIATKVALRTRQTFRLRMSDKELFCRQMHAVFSELARRGLLCYSRVEWKNTMDTMRKPDSTDSNG